MVKHSAPPPAVRTRPAVEQRPPAPQQAPVRRAEPPPQAAVQRPPRPHAETDVSSAVGTKVDTRV